MDVLLRRVSIQWLIPQLSSISPVDSSVVSPVDPSVDLWFGGLYLCEIPNRVGISNRVRIAFAIIPTESPPELISSTELLL